MFKNAEKNHLFWKIFWKNWKNYVCRSSKITSAAKNKSEM